jgi:hypothetical protein
MEAVFPVLSFQANAKSGDNDLLLSILSDHLLSALFSSDFIGFRWLYKYIYFHPLSHPTKLNI